MIVRNPISIRISNNGMWGFTIPDSIMNERIELQLSTGVTIDISGQDFHNLLHIIDYKLQEDVAAAKKLIDRRDMVWTATKLLKEKMTAAEFKVDDGYVYIDEPISMKDVGNLESILEGFMAAVCGGDRALKEYCEQVGE
ncbi:hypothetical protein ACQP3R_22465 [Bacillus inaquosorum]|uniref:hypothetical protein n=1 Tax=Bacillus inaquosorum TaxID=483913 RepID=UPI003D090F18